MGLPETSSMDQNMLEQSLKHMWNDIQRLMAENQRLKECLASLGRWDLINPPNIENSTQPQFSVTAEGSKTFPAKPLNNIPVVVENPSLAPVKNKLSLMQALNATYQTSQTAIAPAKIDTGRLPNIDVGLVKQLTVEQLNNLPYGVVTVDRDGIVLSYNDTESRLAGVPRERVLMRNFFKDVAPCTQVKEFEGRFQSFARGESRAIEEFDFVFNLPSGTQYVTIIFTPGRARGTINIVMTRR
ncbi:MAG: PAS domain-containing protein [Blastocatellia bacterium]|nr:PAS domain-containing protein [Blastocatellia bacterium]